MRAVTKTKQKWATECALLLFFIYLPVSAIKLQMHQKSDASSSRRKSGQVSLLFFAAVHVHPSVLCLLCFCCCLPTPKYFCSLCVIGQLDDFQRTSVSVSYTVVFNAEHMLHSNAKHSAHKLPAEIHVIFVKSHNTTLASALIRVIGYTSHHLAVR